MPFLDILITPMDDASLQTSMYRKPTHTDLYLQWDSHHTIPSKYIGVGALYHRVRTICSNQEILLKEEQHLFQALKKCKYPTWDLNRVKMGCQNCSNKRRNNNNSQQNNNITRNLYIVVPYYQGLSESINIMQEVWGTGALQRRTYHQKPPNGSQGQRSHPEKKWSHIQI